MVHFPHYLRFLTVFVCFANVEYEYVRMMMALNMYIVSSHAESILQKNKYPMCSFSVNIHTMTTNIFFLKQILAIRVTFDKF